MRNVITRLFRREDLETRGPGSQASFGGTSPLPGVIPPSRETGEPVTVESAIGLTPVYRAISIISTLTSQLDLGVWRNDLEIEKPALVRRPDPEGNAHEFVANTTVSLAAHGNAFWRKVYAPDLSVSSLQVLNPNAVYIDYDEQGRRYYNFYRRDGRTIAYTDNEVVHLRLLEVPGHDYGLGPIQAAKYDLGGALDLRDFAGNFFAKGAIPTGVLKTGQELDEDTATAYRTRWEESQENRGIAVLGLGMEYQPLILSPEDAQWLQAKQFAKTEIATLFGVPATYLNAAVEGNSMTYTNLIQVNTVFLQTTLMAYLVPIEQALSDLLPNRQVVKFKVEGLLRADERTRAETYKIYKDMGVLTADEIRQKEGYGPVQVPVAQQINV